MGLNEKGPQLFRKIENIYKMSSKSPQEKQLWDKGQDDAIADVNKTAPQKHNRTISVVWKQRVSVSGHGEKGKTSFDSSHVPYYLLSSNGALSRPT